MKRLTLLRHAKSSWDEPVARDFDRPLNARGIRGADLMGRFARDRDMAFDHLISSPAVRCVETIDHFIESYGHSLETEWDRRIYLAPAGTLVDVINDLPPECEHVLMVGHNPGMEDLILMLVPDDGSSPLRDEVERKFPTAALAVIDLAVDDWADVTKNQGRLTAFTRPRDLDPALGPEAW